MDKIEFKHLCLSGKLTIFLFILFLKLYKNYWQMAPFFLIPNNVYIAQFQKNIRSALFPHEGSIATHFSAFMGIDVNRWCGPSIKL